MLCVYFLFAFTFTLAFCQQEGPHSLALPSCERFEDKRLHKSPTISIPENRTFDGIYASEQTQNDIEYYLRRTTLKCEKNHRKERKIVIDFYKKDLVTSVPRNYGFVESGTTDSPSRSYFTKMNYFFDYETKTYYRPDGEYCIQSVSQKEIGVTVCEIEPKCMKSHKSNTLCLPKCCAFGELFSLPSKTCVDASQIHHSNDHVDYEADKGETWNPSVYHGATKVETSDVLGLYQVDPRTQEITSLKVPISNLTFQLATLPKSCNAKSNREVKTMTAPFFKWYRNDDMIDNHEEFRQIVNGTVRLVLPKNKGQVRVSWHDYETGKFVLKENIEFCVDDYFIESASRQKNHERGNSSFIVVYCEGTQTRSSGGTISNHCTFCLLILNVFLAFFNQLKN